MLAWLCNNFYKNDGLYKSETPDLEQTLVIKLDLTKFNLVIDTPSGLLRWVTFLPKGAQWRQNTGQGT